MYTVLASCGSTTTLLAGAVGRLAIKVVQCIPPSVELYTVCTFSPTLGIPATVMYTVFPVLSCGSMKRLSEAATFGMQEVKLGIPSVIEAALLPTLVGWGRAREIMLLGETFSAATALEWRLVEHVVPAAALDDAVETWIGKLLTSAPRAVRLQKRLIRRWEDLPLADAVRAGIDAFAEAYATDEPAAAMREFLAAQKRKRST